MLKINLELGEGLGSTLSLGDLKNVETNGLGKRTTLTNGNEITTIKRNNGLIIWIQRLGGAATSPTTSSVKTSFFLLKEIIVIGKKW